ncbi:MAG: trehalose-6-phosphate synthase [Gammaproteobacteria bacterium]|nr:trehalose-6-phosphate synthase [Gammaproteobacteria bacterium]
MRLVCVSNRVAPPRRGAAPGGLAVGVLAALRRTGGLWFGWSGNAAGEGERAPEIVARDGIRYATIDLCAEDIERYYNGYCNASLWPLFHYFPGRFAYDEENFQAYQRVNARFATELLKLLRPGDLVWVHDYHLMPLARILRDRGFSGPIGFFLHIPFPHAQVLRVLPNHETLMRDLCCYDLVGLQTRDDVQSFVSAVRLAFGGAVRCDDGRLDVGGRRVSVGTYPIGVDVDAIRQEAARTVQEETVQRLIASLLGRRLIIGVDRLDYSKGLIQRFAAYEHFLEHDPESHGRVTLLQIAPLSRTDVLAYTEIRRALEQATGKLNGRLAAADWTPVRYLNRNYSHATLMGFLRAAHVALITPVRDGMNLVAKEYVAAQDPDDPGVLVLSSLAGAAHELTGALLANPYDRRGIAEALRAALHMPLAERRERHREMAEVLRRNDIHRWSERFCHDLQAAGAYGPPAAA